MVRSRAAWVPALVMAALVTTSPTWAQTTPDPVETVAAHSDSGSRLTVAVRIGERGPFAFLVDTGAERTVLARPLALRLALVPVGKAEIVGIAGTQDVDLVELDTLSLGHRDFHDLVAPLLEQDSLGADGIIGLDGLQGQRVLIDFGRQSLTIGSALALGGDRGFEIVVTARRKSGQLILADALLDGVRTQIIIDTGSDTSIGNRALQQALSRRHKGATVDLVSVTGQSITADIGLASEMKLGGLTLTNTLIAFADSPAFAHLGLSRRPALFLGMRQLRLFRRVAIDFSSRTILFDVDSAATL